MKKTTPAQRSNYQALKHVVNFNYTVAGVLVAAAISIQLLTVFIHGGPSMSNITLACCVTALVSLLSGLMLSRTRNEIKERDAGVEKKGLALLQSSTEATERYKLLTDNLAAAVIVRDDKGKILYCSPYGEILTGYPVKSIYEAIGDFFEGIVHETDREKYTRSFEVTRQGEPFQFRYRFKHKSGIMMWAESRTVPILDDDGRVISSLSITLDVTGTVRYQSQVEEKNKELQDFTYIVSHDLKAPIFTIKGMLGIIDEELGDKVPEPLGEPLDHIHRATRRLEQLVTSVLEYSRASSFEPKEEKIDLKDLISEVVADFASQLAACHGTVKIDPEIRSVVGDPLILVQVFSNLISNAIKYRSKDRELKISIAHRDSEKVSVEKVAVTDNGDGIPPDKVELIFRPFQRLHGKEIEGTGIGLACARKLIERLGGDVSAESDGISGSSFVVSLKAYGV